MSNHTPIATVKAVTGEVFVRNAEGQSRLLKVGDQLKAGDVILPSAGSADLEMVDGTEMKFSDPVEVTLSPEMLSDQTAFAEEESITDPTVAALLSALEAGEDPTQVLPAPAAGPAAGGEGHSFVRLARIVENVEGLGFGGDGFTQFLFDFDSPDLINTEESQPPVAVPDSVSVEEDGSVLIDVLGNDTDADGDLDPSTVTITSPPSSGTVVVDPVTGAVTYTPNDNYNGPDSFEYTVQDADGNTSNPASVTIDVNPVADPPVAVNDQVTTNEDTSLEIDVLVNDEDPDGEIDPTTVVIVAQPDHGTVSVNPDTGVVTYTPDENYNGPDSFQYTVQDNEGNTSAAATVDINVDPVADKPVALDDNVTTDEDVAVTIDVLANDTDPENDIDPTTVMIQSGPSNGSVTVDPVTGEVTYIPNGDYNGPDSFTYTVKDATGLESNVATVNITVSDVLDPPPPPPPPPEQTAPTAADDAVTTDEEVAITVDVLVNDSDPENNIDPTTVMIQTGPTNGSVSVDPVTGEVTYTPNSDYNGPDSFTYTVKDSTGLESNEATVDISVTPVVDPPVNNAPNAANDSVMTPENNEITIDVLDNDTDPENNIDPTTVVIQSGPSNGSVSVNSTTGEVTYTPNGDYSGPDSFTYTVMDTTGLESNEATVDISVTPVVDPPVNNAPNAANDSATTPENTEITIDVLDNDTDPENNIDPTTVVIQSGPSNGSVSINSTTGEVTYTPNGDYNGPDSFTYTVKDATGLESNEATVDISVTPVVDPPVNNAPNAANDSATTQENTEITIDVLDNDTDPENNIDPTTVMIQSGPSNGSVTVNSTTGEVTYTPDADYVGSDSFTYTVKDATGLESNEATVMIDVEEDFGVTIDFTGSSGLEVYDVGLLSVTDTSETANGSFKVTAQDGLASVSIAGVTFTAAQLATASAIAPLTVVSNTDEELVITGYSAATGDVSYSYTLLNPVNHAPGSDLDSVTFLVTATDTDGDFNDPPGSLTISQIDDKPEILSVSDGSGINGVGQILGAISVDSSADSPESFSWGAVSTSVDLYANDELITISAVDATKTVTGKLADDTTVFTLMLNDDLSTYTYHQYMAVQTVATEVGVASNLSGGNSDSFRLSSNGSLEDPIQTLFYGYEFDDDINEFARSTVNTSANSMGVGTGQDVDSDANQEDQLLLHFDKSVLSLSLMVEITGNNTADLRYTVYSVKPSEFNNLGADGFTYDNLPAGGVSNVVSVVDDQSVVITAADLGLDDFTFIVFEADDGAYKLVPNELTVNYLTEAQDFSISSAFNVTDSDQDTDTDTIDINVSGTLDNLTGDGDNNALGGNEEANVLTGLAGNDQLSGNAGDDMLIGGVGNDTLIGGLGSDTFAWTLNDGGVAGAPANDLIADFDSSLPASGGDILDISTLLVGEEGGDLTHFLHFKLNGDGNTELHISTDGDFAGGYDASDVEQVIVMENVDLVSAYTVNDVVNQSDLIQDLVTKGTLITDV